MTLGTVHLHWFNITNLGDAALMLPLALICAYWIRASDKRESLRWVVLFLVGAAIVGLTKFLYAGCGFEVESVRFRVISGHTMLSSAVWTTAIALLFASIRERWATAGMMLGLMLSAVIGVGRVAERAHTPIEVVLGWMLGGGIAVFFLRRFFSTPRHLPRPLVAGAGLLVVSSLAYGHHAPIQRMIVHYSPWLCQWLDF